MYQPTKASLRRHPVPAWYHDAKLGIFIHWGPFSVPAYAPLGHGDIQELLRREGYRSFFRNIPYSEWYINSIRIEGSPACEHHRRTYGKDVSYFDFAELFKRESARWQPDEWADLFQAAGARYVVLVTKHMDGFLMWPSATPNYARPGYQMERDVVGELTGAVKARGMRMGVYYSSALDQSFTTSAMADLTGLLSEGGPIDRRYAEYQLAHWRELIERYQPSVLWGDIAYPPRTNLFELFAYFYNRIPDGVVNDRWGQLPIWLHRFVRTRLGRALLNAYATRLLRQGATGNVTPPHFDFRTPEFAVMKDIRTEKWETCRGMGHGFGFNREEQEGDHIQLPELVRMLVDIVSKNGNLLLNVGPMADGTIPAVQVELLRGLGRWLQTYGEAIYGTRPWQRAEATTNRGGSVRFTQRADDDGTTIYALLMDPIADGKWTIQDLRASSAATARDVATQLPVSLRQDGNDLTLELSGPAPDVPVHAVAICHNTGR
ncbi:MAG TPA: alpha-L-fucosidase [Myxococcota bacterium]|nr:alpha-L-fucosidase [Myxococcota bacterium]